MYHFYSPESQIEKTNEFLEKYPDLKREELTEYLRKKYQKNRINFDISRIVSDIYIYATLIEQELKCNSTMPAVVAKDCKCETEANLIYLNDLASTMYEQGKNKDGKYEANIRDKEFLRFFVNYYDPSIFEDENAFVFYSFAKEGAKVLLKQDGEIVRFVQDDVLTTHIKNMNAAKVMTGERKDMYNFLKELLSNKPISDEKLAL